MDANEVIEVGKAEVETSEAEVQPPSVQPDIVRSESVTEIVKKDSQYEKKLKDFKRSEEKRVQAAEKKLLPRCTSCSKALRSKLDAESQGKTGICFSCYTVNEKVKTDSMIDSKLAEQYDRVAALDFPDFENWLFGDELGERSLMRIIMKIKREGYDIPTWKISLAATAWAMDNYSNTNISETRHIVERSPISQILERIPQNNSDVKALIHKMAEETELHTLRKPQSRFKKEYLYMGVIGGISLMLPILMNKGR